MGYAVVYCGYEGLDAVLWAGDSAETAAAEVRRLRAACPSQKQIEERNERRRDILDDMQRGYDRDLSWEALPRWDVEDPNRVCVMGPQSDRDGYGCVCEDLGVPAEKGWLY